MIVGCSDFANWPVSFRTQGIESFFAMASAKHADAFATYGCDAEEIKHIYSLRLLCKTTATQDAFHWYSVFVVLSTWLFTACFCGLVRKRSINPQVFFLGPFAG